MGSPRGSTDVAEPLLVSVILPVFNGERYVLGAIESVLAQTYERWELIVVNDGSTDGTAAIVERVRDERVRMVSHENRGLAAAKNTGIAEARGGAIAIIDDDDLWMPHKLERQVPLLEPGVLVYSDVVFRDEVRGVDLGGFEIYDRFGGDTSRYAGNVLPAILAQNFLTNVAVLLRRDDARSIGGFREGFDGAEDWDMWARCAERLQFVRIEEPLAIVRRRPGSLSRDTARGLRSTRLVLDDARARLGRAGRLTPELHGALGLGYFAARAMGPAARELGTALLHEPWNLTWWRWLVAAGLWRPIRLFRPARDPERSASPSMDGPSR